MYYGMYSRCCAIGKYARVLCNLFLGSKRVPTAMNMNIVELLLEMVFPARFSQSGYKENIWGDPVNSRQE
jgi:hypothetical protein